MLVGQIIASRSTSVIFFFKQHGSKCIISVVTKSVKGQRSVLMPASLSICAHMLVTVLEKQSHFSGSVRTTIRGDRNGIGSNF